MGLVLSLALMAGAVLFAIESVALTDSAPWLSAFGFLISVVFFASAIWVYLNKATLESQPHSPARTVWWAFVQAVLAAMAGAIAYNSLTDNASLTLTGVVYAVLALITAVRAVRTYLRRHDPTVFDT